MALPKSYYCLQSQPEPTYNQNQTVHELSITESILSIVLEKATTAQASRVTRVSLTVGKLSGVVGDSVEFYFELLSRDTVAAGAVLTIDQPQARLRCRDCSCEFMPADIDWTCPNCQNRGVDIMSGREFFVDSIEVE